MGGVTASFSTPLKIFIVIGAVIALCVFLLGAFIAMRMRKYKKQHIGSQVRKKEGRKRPMRIERAAIDDAPAMLCIYGHYVRNTAVTFEYDVPSAEEFGRRIGEVCARYPCLKAVEEGELIGYAYANAFRERRAYDWAVETTIYIRQDRRKSGIGRVLYGELEAMLRKMGVLNMNACIAVPQTEDEYLTCASFRFHQRMGFAPVGRFHNIGYKFGRWYDIVWMEKMLGEHAENPQKVRFGNWEELP